MSSIGSGYYLDSSDEECITILGEISREKRPLEEEDAAFNNCNVDGASESLWALLDGAGGSESESEVVDITTVSGHSDGGGCASRKRRRDESVAVENLEQFDDSSEQECELDVLQPVYYNQPGGSALSLFPYVDTDLDPEECPCEKRWTSVCKACGHNSMRCKHHQLRRCDPIEDAEGPSEPESFLHRSHWHRDYVDGSNGMSSTRVRRKLFMTAKRMRAH